jgi:hypothetical protein
MTNRERDFLNYLIRLKQGDYRQAFACLKDHEFGDFQQVSADFMAAVNRLFANWCAGFILYRGGWQKRYWWHDNALFYGYLWEVPDFSLRFTRELFYFFADMAKKWHDIEDQGDYVDWRNRALLPADRILLHFLSRELLESNNKYIIRMYSNMLNNVPLNAFLIDFNFKAVPVESNKLSALELNCFFAQRESFADGFALWYGALRNLSPDVFLKETEFIFAKFSACLNMVEQLSCYCMLYPLLELANVILADSSVLSYDHYAKIMNLRKPLRLEDNNVLLRLGSIYEKFFLRLLGLRNKLAGFSFVDEEFSVAEHFLKLFASRFDPFVSLFRGRLQVFNDSVEAVGSAGEQGN